jgi:hypothetical protein
VLERRRPREERPQYCPEPGDSDAAAAMQHSPFSYSWTVFARADRAVSGRSAPYWRQCEWNLKITATSAKNGHHRVNTGSSPRTPEVGVSDALANRTNLRLLHALSKFRFTNAPATAKWLFMDSEARLVQPRPRWMRSWGSSTWEGISASPGPHQQGKVTAMSGHIATTRDQYVEVTGTQFSPDAAPRLRI